MKSIWSLIFAWFFILPHSSLLFAAEIGLILDCSGSMKEQRRMEYAKEAAKLVCSMVDPEDKLVLVGFNEVASVSKPFEMTNDQVRQSAMDWLADLQIGGGTNYLSGLKAYTFKPGARVIFLSDGEHSEGASSEVVEFVQDQLAGKVKLHTVAVGCAKFSDAEKLLQQMASATKGSYTRVERSEALVESFVKILVRFAGYRKHIPLEKELKLTAVSGRLFAFAFDGEPQIIAGQNLKHELSHQAKLPGEDVRLVSADLKRPGDVTIQLVNSAQSRSRLGDVFRSDLPKAILSTGISGGRVAAGSVLRPVLELKSSDGKPVAPHQLKGAHAEFELVDENGKIVNRTPAKLLANQSSFAASLKTPAQAGALKLRGRSTIQTAGQDWVQEEETQLSVEKVYPVSISPNKLNGTVYPGFFEKALVVKSDEVQITGLSARMKQKPEGVALVNAKSKKGDLHLSFDIEHPGRFRGEIVVTVQSNVLTNPIEVPFDFRAVQKIKGLQKPVETVMDWGTVVANSGIQKRTVQFPTQDTELVDYQIDLKPFASHSEIIKTTLSSQKITTSAAMPGSIAVTIDVGKLAAGDYTGELVFSTKQIRNKHWKTIQKLKITEPLKARPLYLGEVEVGSSVVGKLTVHNRSSNPLKVSVDGNVTFSSDGQSTDQIGIHDLKSPFSINPKGACEIDLKVAVSPLLKLRGRFSGILTLRRGEIKALNVPVSLNVVDEGEGPALFSVTPNEIHLEAKPGEVIRFPLQINTTHLLTTNLSLSTEFGLFKNKNKQPIKVVSELKWVDGQELRPGHFLDLKGYLLAPTKTGVLRSEIRIKGAKHGLVVLPLTIDVRQ